MTTRYVWKATSTAGASLALMLGLLLAMGACSFSAQTDPLKGVDVPPADAVGAEVAVDAVVPPDDTDASADDAQPEASPDADTIDPRDVIWYAIRRELVPWILREGDPVVERRLEVES